MGDIPYNSTIMYNQNEFSGKRVIITGAAVGIGKETAIQLSKMGAILTLIDIDKDELAKTALSLSNEKHIQIQFDIGNVEEIESKIKEIIELSGPVDGFVHCVGIRSRRPISLLSPKILADVMRINFGSFIEMIRCLTKKNHYNDGLSIVGVSSISSVRGGASVTAYAASKAAIDGAVRCLAKELASKKIRLNTVVPAQINTPAYANLSLLNPDKEDITLSRQYLGLGDPIDVANTIIFLLSSKSSFISGSAIPVDGGFLSS